MGNEQSILEDAYRAFNTRDIEAALALMHPDVDWPNGWEGGRVRGREAVREYWTRQWAAIDPRVEPTKFEKDDAGRTIVHVHTVVRDRAGSVVADQTIRHIYRFEGSLIRRMDIGGE